MTERNRLIIETRDGVGMADALRRALHVVEKGRVSGREDRRQYCYVTIWEDGICIAAGLNKCSDRLVVTRQK